MRNWLSWLFGVRPLARRPQTVPEAAPAPVEPAKREPMRIDPLAGRVAPKRALTAADFTAWQKRARPLPGVVGATGGLAMDSACFPSFTQFSEAYGGYDPDLVFLGYPTLSAMAQRVEYRNLVTAYAREATRKWVELKGANDDDDRIAQILAAWEDMGIRAAITTLVEKEGYFGRAHLYLNISNADRALPLVLTPETVDKDTFRGVQVIEPLWTYPSVFNSTDPFAADFYQTREWFVMGDKVHCTRLLTLVTHPVPDMLKSMYSFGGVARTQLIKPYVDNWLRSRQSVSDTMHKFSKVALKTNLAGVLAGGGAEQMMLRAALFNEARDNGGSFLLDMTDEDLMEVSTPLSSLDKLQSQSFEQIAAAGQIPLLIYCRVTPSGLNASSEGELQAWYDGINALQEDELRPILQTVLDLTQLSLFGKIDPDIKIHFVPLYQMNELEKATIRKTDADAAVALINAGVLDPADERDRMGKDEQSLYYGMALTEPEPIEPPDDGAGGEEADPFDGAQDAFEEGDHPRDESGKFSASQGATLTEYTGGDYHEINTTLREGEAPSSSMQRKISEIDEVLSQSTLDKDTVVYRGFYGKGAKDLRASVKAGDVIEDPAFMSTTTKESIAENLANRTRKFDQEGVKLKIAAPKGARGADLSGLSQYGGEGEILFPRGSKIKITKWDLDKGEFEGVLVND